MSDPKNWTKGKLLPLWGMEVYNVPFVLLALIHSSIKLSNSQIVDDTY